MKSGIKPIFVIFLNIFLCLYLGLIPLFLLAAFILLLAGRFQRGLFWIFPALILLLIRWPELGLVSGVGASVMMMQLWSILRQPQGPYLQQLASVTWFASLPAGPIHRSPTLFQDEGAWELGNEQNYLRLASGFLKCSLGLLLSQHLRQYELFIQGGSLPTVLVLAVFSILLFYCQLAGMSDIAIAVSRFMGVRLPENFDHPERSHHISDFWRRWHATLNQWFFHEVYFPLAFFFQRRFPRAGSFLAVLVLFVTAVLVGLWHGVTGVFLVWGVVNGLLLVLLRFFDGKIGMVLSWIGIFFLFLLMRLKSPSFLPTLGERIFHLRVGDFPFLGVSALLISACLGLLFLCNRDFSLKSRWWPLFVVLFCFLGFLVGHPNGNVLYPGF